MKRRVGVVLAAGLLLTVAAACDSGGPDTVCNGSAGAQVCLKPQGDGYELTASGFQPGTQILLAADGEGSRAIDVNPEGGIAEGGVIEVAGEKGPERPKRVTVHGTTQEGTTVTFDVVP